MNFKAHTLFLLCTLVLSFLTTYSQNKTRPLEKIRALDLDSSKYEVIVYHPEGAHEKAKDLGPLMADALEYYEENFGTDLNFRLALLDENTWHALDTDVPYGLPFYSAGNTSIAIIPSRADGVVYDFMLKIKDKVSPDLRSEISEMGYSYEKFSAKMLDLIGFHEIGHAYMNAYGINVTNHWLNEFVANYFSYAFLRRTNPDLADLWDLSNRVILDAYSPIHNSLDTFNEKYAGVGVADYAWYQCMFEKRANQLFDKRGERFLKELKEEFPAGAEDLDDNEALLSRLEKIEPGFVEWSEEFK
ncbi:hypothetical protein NE848_08065 [Gramella jeungdoensis]|uniref:DUF1570 domain-containing protein n=1 Tax=Gramella jeungdoensis TaxID=708091 RepID=A0ABT0Z0T4_9FLAO|nr:hypothetical protein [Gramella jeungdoensis]MCM8569331.1 hypothetical protein [Gramella jeungdoensis]